ncbi:hypothetical protein ACSSVZ_003451 [Amorphus sp. MBR-141]
MITWTNEIVPDVFHGADRAPGRAHAEAPHSAARTVDIRVRDQAATAPRGEPEPVARQASERVQSVRSLVRSGKTTRSTRNGFGIRDLSHFFPRGRLRSDRKMRQGVQRARPLPPRPRPNFLSRLTCSCSECLRGVPGGSPQPDAPALVCRLMTCQNGAGQRGAARRRRWCNRRGKRPPHGVAKVPPGGMRKVRQPCGMPEVCQPCGTRELCRPAECRRGAAGWPTRPPRHCQHHLQPEAGGRRQAGHCARIPPGPCGCPRGGSGAVDRQAEQRGQETVAGGGCGTLGDGVAACSVTEPVRAQLCAPARGLRTPAHRAK